MPKKSEFLPPPKPDSHPEEAAILTRIFKKEPLITYRELLDKYKSEVSEKQALSGLLGLFTAYVDRPDDDPLFPQLMQAKQAALQMEILSRQPRARWRISSRFRVVSRRLANSRWPATQTSVT